MAEAGAPTQSGPIAVPPVREKHPGHAPTEAEFFAAETAGLIGGRHGIPNGMLAAAAAGAPGSPDDVGSLLGRLDGRRARGLALQLQRTMGNGGLHRMLASSGAAPVIQRQPPAAGPANASAPPPNASMPPPNASVPDDPDVLHLEATSCGSTAASSTRS
jgi:hypothetical protein